MVNAFRINPLIVHIRTWVRSDGRWVEWWWRIWRTIRCICEDPTSNHDWIKKKILCTHVAQDRKCSVQFQVRFLSRSSLLGLVRDRLDAMRQLDQTCSIRCSNIVKITRAFWQFYSNEIRLSKNHPMLLSYTHHNRKIIKLDANWL